LSDLSSLHEIVHFSAKEIEWKAKVIASQCLLVTGYMQNSQIKERRIFITVHI
jgi:hypothetical protein